MQVRLDVPATSTLAICGWTRRTPSLLQAVEARGLVPIAVADRSAAALIEAASAFRGRVDGPARYQHPQQMLRRAGGATVLLDMPEAAAEAAVAAQRGASVLVAGDAIEPETLDMLARTRAVATIVRPLWWHTPMASITEAARTAGRLSSITLAAREDRPAQAIAEDLMSLAARLSGKRIESVTCNVYAPPHREMDSVVTSLRFADNTTALLIARKVRSAHIQAELSSSTARVRAAGDDAGGTLTVTAAGHSSTTTLVGQDRIALAIDHALEELAGGGMGSGRLLEEAALLRRFGDSLDGVASPEPAHARWDILAGGGHRSTPRSGHLHLVTA